MHRFIFGMALALMALVLAATSPTQPVEAATAVRTQPNSYLSVSLYGPTTTARWQRCRFMATVAGGTEPYTYTWTTVNMDGGEAGDLSFWNGYIVDINAWGQIQVQVTDATNQTAVAYHFVQWGDYAPSWVCGE